nr:putative reverse transcriptase, RNA-dependent DNA polymerase, Gag-polypeptide of LTR copia-type [Tanacetum cinerariifolium]
MMEMMPLLIAMEAKVSNLGYDMFNTAVFISCTINKGVKDLVILTEDGGRPVIWFDVEKEVFGLIDPLKRICDKDSCSYRSSSKKEYTESRNDLATTLYMFLSEATADPSALVDSILSKKPRSLCLPTTSNTSSPSKLATPPSTLMEENTPPEGISKTKPSLTNKTNVSDQPAESVVPKRSSRPSKVPRNLNDFVIEGKVKYGVERVVNYSNLSNDNFCFTSNINKSIEPKTYQEATLDTNWINAMNNDIEALNMNKTWIITDLPPNRKAIGCKWVYRIKYKSTGKLKDTKLGLLLKATLKERELIMRKLFLRL